MLLQRYFPYLLLQLILLFAGILITYLPASATSQNNVTNNTTTSPSEKKPIESEQAFNQLALLSHQQGKFTQTRNLTGISFPLISSGIFIFIKDLGLYNETQKPLFQAVSFSTSGVIEWNQSEEITTNKDTKNRADKFVSQLLLAMFNGDKKRLESLFEVQEKTEISRNDKPYWHLSLNPKSILVKEQIDSITVTGTTTIEQIQILTSNGDKTAIQFTAISPLTKQQLKTFCHKFPDNSLPDCQG